MFILTKSVAVAEEKHAVKKILSAWHNFIDTPKAGKIWDLAGTVRVWHIRLAKELLNTENRLKTPTSMFVV